MKKNFNYIMRVFQGAFCALGLSALITACSEDLDVNPGIIPNVNMVTLQMEIPAFLVENIGSRAGDSPVISDVTVFVVKNDGTYTRKNALVTGTTVSFEKDDNAARYEFVAGYTFLSSDENKKPNEIITNDPSKDILWGSVDNSDISTGVVSMLRHNAAVDVTLVEGSITDEGSTFSFEGFNVYGTAKTGTVGPLYTNYDATKNPKQVTGVTLPSSLEYTTVTDEEYDTSLKEIFETANTSSQQGKIIIKGSFNGKEGYYPLTFAEREGSGNSEIKDSYNYSLIDILRNHKYTVKIQYVRGEGYETPEKAFEAKPDNRITYLIEDTNATITDIIACRDYALGVGLSRTTDKGVIENIGENNLISQSGETLTLSIVSSYSKGTPSVYLADENENELKGENLWITWTEPKGTGEIPLENDRHEIQSGKVYSATVTVTANPNYSIREGYIVVSHGDLERKLPVKQEKVNYYIDPRVELQGMDPEGNNSGTIDNYFEFIQNNNGIFGLKKEQNRNQDREGLHFPAVPDGKSLVYIIDADGTLGEEVVSYGFNNTTSTTAGNFKCEKSGKTYKITCETPTGPTLSSAMFSLNLKDKQKLVYNVYQTGFFHYLSQSIISTYSNGENLTPGWYYYELVRSNTGGFWLLDRNLGAKSNDQYITTNTTARSHTDAIGGYFKVATVRFPNTDEENLKNVESTVTIVDQQDLNLKFSNGSFKIPTEDHLKKMGITTSTISGTSIKIFTIPTALSSVSNNMVYLPHAGFYVGNDFRNQDMANIWTRSLHCYNQGFDSNLSKEFGLWYRYLNGFTTSGNLNITQMRIIEGGEGSINPNMPWHYMPIRLVWADQNGNSGDGSAPIEPDVKKTYRIYWPKNFGKGLYVWYSSGNNKNWEDSKQVGLSSNTYKGYYYHDIDNMTSQSTFNYKFSNNQGNEKESCNRENVSKTNFQEYTQADGSILCVAYVKDGDLQLTKDYPLPSRYYYTEQKKYLRGDFNWGIGNEYQFYQVAPNTYETAYLQIESGQEFKLCDDNENWDGNFNWGSENLTTIDFDTEVSLKKGKDSKNLKINDQFKGFVRMYYDNSSCKITLVEFK